MFELTKDELVFIHGILANAPLNFQQGQVRVQIMAKIENTLKPIENEQGNKKADNK